MAGSETKASEVRWSNFQFSTQQVKHTFEIVLHSLGSADEKMSCFENPAFLFIPFAIFAFDLEQSIMFPSYSSGLVFCISVHKIW